MRPVTSRSDPVVVDASALVDVLLGKELGRAAADRLKTFELHAPAHFDFEVLSALGRVCRAGKIGPAGVSVALRGLRRAPIHRHPIVDLVEGAWARRDNIWVADALYVELAHRLDTIVLTTDARLARATHLADLVTV